AGEHLISVEKLERRQPAVSANELIAVPPRPDVDRKKLPQPRQIRCQRGQIAQGTNLKLRPVVDPVDRNQLGNQGGNLHRQRERYVRDAWRSSRRCPSRPTPCRFRSPPRGAFPDAPCIACPRCRSAGKTRASSRSRRSRPRSRK